MSTEAIAGLLGRRAEFLGFVQRRVRNAAQAEDLLQSSYAKALQGQGELRSDEAAVAWFYRILRNSIMDYFRRRTVEERIFNSEVIEEELRSAIPESEITPCSCVHGAMKEIIPAYRDVLERMYLSGDERETLGEMAQGKGISAGNAAVRAHRARRALKSKLMLRCGICAQAGCLDCTCG